MFCKLLSKWKNHSQTAVIEGEKSYSFLELNKKADILGEFLPKKRQVVAIFLPNGGDFVCALWGVLQRGHVAFPINVFLTEYEVLPLILKSKATVLVTNGQFLEVAEKIAKNAKIELFCMENLPNEAKNPQKGRKLAGFFGKVLYLNTSGTTGNCKIVPLSQKNLETSFLGYCRKMKFFLGQKCRFLLAVPFCSAYGIMILAACLRFGFCVVVFDGVFTLNSLFSLIERHGVTHYEGSASPILMLEQFGSRQIGYDIDKLKFFGFGGSKISGKSIKNAMRIFPDKGFYQGYGMTEASPLIAKFECGKPVDFDGVGTALKGVKIAIFSDEKITFKRGVIGEILVKGKNVMSGYLDNKIETKLMLKKGFLHTGDIGFLDKNGVLHICGRKKSLIVSRGYKIFPEEVEQCILNSKLAVDCRVFGRADQFGKEIVCAEVVSANSSVTEGEILEFCAIHLAEFKLPQKIEFCQEIFRQPSGKIKRGQN